MENNILAESGWGDLAKQKYPFILDTGIFCVKSCPSIGIEPLIPMSDNSVGARSIWLTQR